jgi:hypothetical protein
MQTKQKRTGKYLIVWVIGIICAVILFFETINHRLSLNDFRVYYEATNALISGDQVYGIAFGLDTGMFKYSPFVLFLFIPFAILPFSVSGILYFLFIVTALILSFLLCRKILITYLFDKPQKYEAFISVLALVFISNHLYRELHLGNTNIILIFLILISLKLILEEKDFIGGILIGIAFLLKPYLLLLGIVLVLHKKWKVIAGTVAMMALQGIILMLVLGFSKAISLNAEWIKTMATHAESYGSQNNIAYLLHMLFNIEISPVNNYIIILVSALLLSGFIIYNLVLSAGNPNYGIVSQKNFIVEWLIVFAALPSIVNTDTQHFMYSLPLIMMMLFYLFQKKNYLLGSIMFAIFLLYGTNSNDLVGDTLGNFYDRIGAVGISNIMIILLVVYISMKEDRKNSEREINSPGSIK